MAVDQDVLVRVLFRERAKLLAYIGVLVRDEQLAEDIFQELGVLALSKQDEIEGEGHLMGWLRRAARFRCLKALRRRRRQPAPLDDRVLELLEDQWREADALPSADLTAALGRCMERLSEYGRRLVRLRYAEGRSGAQVAEALDRKVRTVYTALARVHRQLAECIRRRLAARGLSDSDLAEEGVSDG